MHPRLGQETVEIPRTRKIFKDNHNIRHDLMLLRLPNAVNFPTVQLPDCDNRPNM